MSIQSYLMPLYARFAPVNHRPKIHPERSAIDHQNVAVRINRAKESEIRPATYSEPSATFNDPCYGIYKKLKEPNAYLQYQKSLSIR
jgi:hypothetical protein